MNYHIPKMPTKEVLSIIDKYFEYDPIEGELYRQYGRDWQKCGYISNQRYKTKIGTKAYYVHHICWYIYYEEWPDSPLDHIDNDGFNNKIENLRKATVSGNNRNVNRKKRNKYVGVYCKYAGTWFYLFVVEGKIYYKAGFVTEYEAMEAREKVLDEIGDKFSKRNKQ